MFNCMPNKVIDTHIKIIDERKEKINEIYLSNNRRLDIFFKSILLGIYIEGNDSPGTTSSVTI